MYFILCIVLFIVGLFSFSKTGDFDQFFKMTIISGIFGLCDSINNCSLKQLLYTYKSMYNEKMNEKGSTKEEK